MSPPFAGTLEDSADKVAEVEPPGDGDLSEVKTLAQKKESAH